MDKIERIKELIGILNNASNTYYNSTPTMTDYEWDKLYEELKSLEKETDVIYPNSPTQNVGYKVLDEIKEVVKQNFDKTVEFVDVAPAEQYRESLLMKKQHH